MTRLALLIQLATTLPLVGLIWVVQIVAYPLFARVGAPAFVEYHAAHARLITFVVAPLMLAELAGSAAFALARSPLVPPSVAWLGLACTISLWLTTMFVSVPQHDVLARGFDERAWRTLLTTNWIRTALWTARAALLLWAVAGAIGRIEGAR